MAKNLVIVESPAKVKTIKKFLGSNYEVDASGGHVRDLPKSTLGVDVEHGYERSISPSGERAMCWRVCGKRLKKQIRFISQLTRTARERRSPGT